MLAAGGLALAVAVSGPASAREVWCPDEKDVFDVNTGERYQTMVGPATKIVNTRKEKITDREVSWRGDVQVCAAESASACEFRVQQEETISYTEAKNYVLGVGGAGGALPLPFPVGGSSYTTTKTNTTTFDHLNVLRADPGDQYQPIVFVEYTRHHGEYVGRYDALGSSAGCKYPYSLNTTAHFGNPSIDIATEPISGWEKV